MEGSRGPGFRPSLIFGVSLLVLLAFFLRLYRIDFQSLWVDENYTLFISGKDLASITQITSLDVHPPLYYYFVHYWVGMTGQSEFSLRFMSLFFSLPLVPLTFKLGSVLIGRRVGAMAAFLAAIAPFQVYYAQEARMYSLMTLLSLLSIFAMVRVARYGPITQVDTSGAKRDWPYWATLVLSSGTLLYAHYFGGLVILFQNTVILLTRVKQKGFFLRWCLSQLMVVAIFLPWIPVMTRTYVTNDEDWRRFIPFLQMFQDTMVSLSLGKSMNETLYLVLASGFFLALALGMVVLGSKRGARHVLLFLGLYVFQPILITYFLSFNKPVFGASRYLIFVAPGFYILVGLGLLALRERSRPGFAVMLAFLVLASGYALSNNYFDDAYAKDDYRTLARVIETKAGPEDGLVIMNGLVFDYYYKGQTPRLFVPQQYPLNQEQIIGELNRFSHGKSRLWMLRWAFNGLDPDDFILHQLEDHGTVLEEGQIRGLYYTLFKPDSDAPFGVAVQHPLAASFENKVALSGFSLSREKAAAGRGLDVTLYMKASEKLDRDYKVSAFLTDSQGYRWAQEDRPPTGYSMSRWRVGEQVETRIHLDIPLGTPPGEYSLSAVVYSPASLEPLAVLDSRQAPLGTSLRLGKLQVERGQLPYGASAVGRSHTLDRGLAPEIRLVGYDLSAGEIDQGGSLTLALYWQALEQPAADYAVSLKLFDAAGGETLAMEERPHHGQYSTLDWRKGEIVRDVHILRLGGAARPGKSSIFVSLGASGSTPVELASVLIKEKTRSFAMPVVQRPWEAELGGKVGFLGYAVDGGPARPGGKLGLTLYWQARAGETGNFTVFTHLLDSQNRVWGQHDGDPAGGTQPTSSWVEGQVITDPHQLAVKPDAPPGEYVVEVGMYDPASGARLKLPNGDDRILLDKVEVVPPS